MDNFGTPDQVSLDTTTPDTVNLTEGSQTNPPSPETVTNRATRTSFGLGDHLGMSMDDIAQRINNGEEDTLRSQASSAVNNLKLQQQNKQLYDAARQGPVPLEQVQQIYKPIVGSDPATVIEKSYAETYMNKMYDAAFHIQDSFLNDAIQSVPEAVVLSKDTASNVSANIQYAITKVENANDAVQQQGYISRGTDIAKQMLIPGYENYMLGTGISPLGFGLEAKAQELLTKYPNIEEFKPQFDAIYEPLLRSNPALAAKWASAVVGMSTNQKVLDTVLNVLDVAGTTSTALSGVKLINNVRKGYQTAVRASATARPTPASMAEGFGDIEEAAVQRASGTLRAGGDGTYRPTQNNAPVTSPATSGGGIPQPTKEGLESLPTGLRTDREKLVNDAQGTGSLSRELTVRLEQDYLNAEQKSVDTVTGTSKVQRTAIDYATPEQLRDIKRNVVESQYPSVHNMILDIGDPVYDDLANIHRIPIKFGDYDATQFLTEDATRARMALEGWVDATVEGKPGLRAYLPEAAVKRPWETESRFGEFRNTNGVLTYFDKDGVQYAFSKTPKEGHIPVEINGNDIKFHPTLQTAEDVAKATVEQHGLGFHFVSWVPLDEENHMVRDLLVKLEGSKSLATTPGLDRNVNAVMGFGYLRSSDNTLAPFEVHQRKTATYATSNYQKYLQDEMQMVEDVARGRVRVNSKGELRNPILSKVDSFGRKLTQRRVWDEFKRTLAQGPKMDDPHNPGEKGYFFETVSELNHFYLENFQRLPSFTEVRGYQAFRRMYEADRIWRGLREYTNKSRLGGMQHQFSYVPARSNSGEKIISGFFEGVSMKNMPTGEWPIAIVGKDGTIRIAKGNALGSNYKKAQEAVTSGTAQAVEVYNPELFSFNHIPELNGQFIRYIVAPSFERKNLDWNQINRKSGGHFDFDYDNYIKQAHIQEVQVGEGKPSHLYLGDKTFMAIKNRAQGKIIVDKLNKAMELMPKDEPAARKIIEGELSIPWKKWKGNFSPSKDPKTGVITEPNLKLGEPFRVVPRGGSIGTMDKELSRRFQTTLPNGKVVDTYRDGSHSSSLARNYQVAYTQERDSHDLMSMNIEGTKNNPIFKYEPAEFVDPITTMNRALNRLVQSSFMDDQKIVSMKLWLNEASPWLKEKDTRIQSSPYSTFLESDSKDAFMKDAPPVIVNNLLSNRFKTKMFLGMPSWFDAQMHMISQNLADSLFDKLGPKSDLIPVWALSKIDSPVRLLRAFAYHVKMGVWSPHQIITQGQSFATIASVAPRSAVGGTIGNFLHELALWNSSPGFLAELDKIAVHMGTIPGFHAWKTGEWIEAFQELKRRGFANVGGEYAPLDIQQNKSYIRNEWGKFLDAATMFFTGIESRVRRGAWYSAYLEGKRTHPTGIFSDVDKAKVLDRADDLSGNMSRASASILQSGPLSPVMQFSKYQIGLAEYFWGKRLGGVGATATDRNLARLRMFLAYQLIFGFGGAVGLGGLPMGDYFRKVAINHGYVIGDNWASTMLMEGPTSYAIAWATGDAHNVQKGNWFNLNRLGANGITQLADLFNGDKTWWDMVPSTSIGYHTFLNTAGFRRDMASMLPGGDPDKRAFKLKASDFTDMIREVSSADSVIRFRGALGTGKWINKNEQSMTDVSASTALTMALTGLSLQEADDDFLMSSIGKDDKKVNDYAMSLARREGLRALQALNDHDPQQYEDYMRKAFGWLDFFQVPEELYRKFAAGLANGREDQVDTARYNWAYGINTPKDQKSVRQDAFKTFEKQKQ